MAPRASNGQKKANTASSGSRLSKLKLETVSLSGMPKGKKQALKPLSSLSKPPTYDLSSSQADKGSCISEQGDQSKPKARSPSKRYETPTTTNAPVDDRMWVDLYEPTTEADLAVHVRKVQDVRQWLVEAFGGGASANIRKFRRILVLTGPAGTAKTTTLRVLARELGFEILEWRNSMDDKFSIQDAFDYADRIEYEGLADKLQSFLTRASSCRSIFSATPTSAAARHISPPQSSSQHSNRGSSQPRSSNANFSSMGGIPKQQVILLEDLPNVLHGPTQTAFHAALDALVSNPSAMLAPVVIIISDTGLRGEATEDGLSGSGMGWKGKEREVVDIRTVLPASLLTSPHVTQVAFNPVAPTLMRRVLQQLINTHFRTSLSQDSRPQRQALGNPPSKDVLDIIIDSSNGDIRSAIMALQFACTSDTSISTSQGKCAGKKKAHKGPNARLVMEAVTRREQSLALFHLIGKVLYNKRKGEAPAASTSAKDAQRERESDARLKDPPKLPPHLKEHERKASRVDIEMLYADSPIDSSLLSLYIHQNYTQYCNEVDECDGVMDWLSWVDSSGGESWYQANPHRFHLLTLGTLHSLPSPVVRRNQKPYKPAFFDVLKTGRAGEDGVRDVQAWLRRDDHGCRGGWSRGNIALELGGVLKARESASQTVPVPPTHRLFSRMEFVRGSPGSAELADDGDIPQQAAFVDVDDGVFGDPEEPVTISEADRGGWLEGDDIEEF